MKHLEPSQKPILKEKGKKPTSSKFKFYLIAATLIAGMGFGMTTLWNPASSDNISDARKSELIYEFSKLKSIDAERVLDQDTDKALDTMNLPPDQKQLLKTALLSPSAKTTLPTIDEKSSQKMTPLQADSTGLVWVSLWDFASPDGDVVHVSSAGYEMDISLQKLQNKIAIPIDATRTVKLTGVHDGGGGITLGIESGSTSVFMPVLKEGQLLTLPVSY
jgi:hypothetical protein